MLAAQLPAGLECLDVSSHPSREVLRATVRKAQLLRLAMKGVTATDAARIVGCAADTARIIYRDPEFKRAVVGKVERAFEEVDVAYVEKRKSLHEMIEEQAYESFTDLVNMLARNDLSDAVRMHVNQDFLDRCAETQAGQKLTHRMDPEQLSFAARVAREMDARRQENIVDIAPDSGTG